MYDGNKIGMVRQSLTHTTCSGNCGSAEIGVYDGEAFPHTPNSLYYSSRIFRFNSMARPAPSHTQTHTIKLYFFQADTCSLEAILSNLDCKLS